MEKDIDREKFKEKKRAELEALYDAVNEETLMITCLLYTSLEK